MRRIAAFALVVACGGHTPPVASTHVASQPSARPIPVASGWHFRGASKTLAGRGARIASGPSRETVVLEIGSPRADEPLSAGTNGFDVDGRAVAHKSVQLTGCKARPDAPASLTIAGSVADGFTVSTPAFPKLVDLGDGTSAAAFDLHATFDCAGAWAKWLALPLGEALRDGRVFVNASEYVVPSKPDLEWTTRACATPPPRSSPPAGTTACSTAPRARRSRPPP